MIDQTNGDDYKNRFSIVGTKSLRTDDNKKATGEVYYTVDIRLPGMLVGKVLRSPYSHAKIISIDISKANTLNGVKAIITFENIPKVKFNGCLADVKSHPDIGKSLIKDQYVLTDKVRYVGDAVAAVAAVNESIAQKALELIDVKYESLPAVFDPLQAMKIGPPWIHDFAPNNIAQHMKYLFGQGIVESGFDEADVVVEETFMTSKQKHCQMENDASIACFDSTGRLTIWSQCQAPHPAKKRIADIFGLPEGMVRLITPPIGGGFGGRSNLNNELICVALSREAGKPVKIEYTREEYFTAHHSRQPYVQTGKIGVKKDGTITALQTKLISNCGAYFEASNGTTGLNMNSFMALYRCANTQGEADIVYTNLPISGGMRGFGNPQAMFVLEQIVDMACEKIGMDPLKFRLDNHKKAGDPSWYAPLPIASCALDQCLKIGAERVGWKEKRKSQREQGIKKYGIGLAIGSHPSDIRPIYNGHSSAFVKINEDGSATITVSPSEIGQGILGTLSQIAAEELGLRIHDIHVVTGDTDTTLFDIGIYGSRGLYSNGKAVLRASREAKGKILDHAAKHLSVDVPYLDIADGLVFVKSDREKKVRVADIAKQAIYNFSGQSEYISGQASWEPTVISPSYHACFVEVEVDTELGLVKVLNVVAVQDSGIPINPMVVEGQIEGGLIQGIGYALTEDYIINMRNGGVETDNFNTYKIPSTTDIPHIEVILIQEPDPAGPFGAKGCGEVCSVAVAAATGNAIYNAIGVRILDLPITPEKILKALKVTK